MANVTVAQAFTAYATNPSAAAFTIVDNVANVLTSIAKLKTLATLPSSKVTSLVLTASNVSPSDLDAIYAVFSGFTISGTVAVSGTAANVLAANSTALGKATSITLTTQTTAISATEAASLAAFGTKLKLGTGTTMTIVDTLHNVAGMNAATKTLAALTGVTLVATGSAAALIVDADKAGLTGATDIVRLTGTNTRVTVADATKIGAMKAIERASGATLEIAGTATAILAMTATAKGIATSFSATAVSAAQVATFVGMSNFGAASTLQVSDTVANLQANITSLAAANGKLTTPVSITISGTNVVSAAVAEQLFSAVSRTVTPATGTYAAGTAGSAASHKDYTMSGMVGGQSLTLLGRTVTSSGTATAAEVGTALRTGTSAGVLTVSGTLNTDFALTGTTPAVIATRTSNVAVIAESVFQITSLNLASGATLTLTGSAAEITATTYAQTMATKLLVSGNTTVANALTIVALSGFSASSKIDCIADSVANLKTLGTAGTNNAALATKYTSAMVTGSNAALAQADWKLVTDLTGFKMGYGATASVTFATTAALVAVTNAADISSLKKATGIVLTDPTTVLSVTQAKNLVDNYSGIIAGAALVVNGSAAALIADASYWSNAMFGTKAYSGQSNVVTVKDAIILNGFLTAGDDGKATSATLEITDTATNILAGPTGFAAAVARGTKVNATSATIAQANLIAALSNFGAGTIDIVDTAANILAGAGAGLTAAGAHGTVRVMGANEITVANLVSLATITGWSDLAAGATLVVSDAETVLTGANISTLNTAAGATAANTGEKKVSAIKLTGAPTIPLTAAQYIAAKDAVGAVVVSDTKFTVSLAATNGTINAYSALKNVGTLDASAIASTAITIGSAGWSSMTTGLTIKGGGGGDTIYGTGGGDNIITGLGDDTINGFVGADTVDGGGGTDTIILAATSESLNKATNAQLVNVEAINASSASLAVKIDISLQSEGFTITGTSLGDTLKGGLGADVFVDFSSGDTVDGGDGSDSIKLSASGATTFLNDATDAQISKVEIIDATARSAATTITMTNQTEALTIKASNSGDTITGTAVNDTIYGGSGADSVAGGAGNDVFIGYVGADTLSGGDGADTLQLNAASPTGVYTAGTAGSVASSKNYTLTTLTKGSSFTLFGRIVTATGGDATAADIATQLAAGTGTTGNAVVSGTLAGATLAAASTTHIVATAASNASVAAEKAFDLSKSYTFGTDGVLTSVETIDATGSIAVTLDIAGQTEGFKVIGSSASDTITGTAAVDNILAGAGDDTIVGFAGADTVDGGDGTDTITLAATSTTLNAATDAQLVKVEAITASAAVTVNLSLQSERIDVTGSGSADTITGSKLGSLLSGGAGVDTITGGVGADTITGGAGADSLSGGATGINTFVYSSFADSVAATFDTIADFKATDLFKIGHVVASTDYKTATISTSSALATDLADTAKVAADKFVANGATLVTISAGTAAGRYLVIGDGTGGFNASNDAVIKLTGTAAVANTNFIV